MGLESEELCEAIGIIKKFIKHAQKELDQADFEIFGTPNAELAKWIIENLDYDQLILEYHNT